MAVRSRGWFGMCVLVATGCRSVLGIEDPLPLPSDAAEAPGDGAAEVCYGAPGFEVCLPAAPTAPITLSASTTFITDGTGPSPCAAATTPNGTSWCVLAATDITISAGKSLIATGARPLVLLATGSLTIEGTVDVSSTRTREGAGYVASRCVALGGTSNIDAATGMGSAGGGAGGTHGTAGGNGGRSNLLGGTARMPATTFALVGGCPGGRSDPDGQIVGSPGGGAVYLAAVGELVISGVVTASGAGGEGGPIGGATGGGGGGSGGSILLWAGSLGGGGLVVANGGGGGGGTDIADIVPGRPGADAAVGNGGISALVAVGGDSSPRCNGGTGGVGAGATSETATTAFPARGGDNGGSGTCGGGGGGGGHGMIQAPATMMLRFSPRPR